MCLQFIFHPVWEEICCIIFFFPHLPSLYFLFHPIIIVFNDRQPSPPPCFAFRLPPPLLGLPVVQKFFFQTRKFGKGEGGVGRRSEGSSLLLLQSSGIKKEEEEEKRGGNGT